MPNAFHNVSIGGSRRRRRHAPALPPTEPNSLVLVYFSTEKRPHQRLVPPYGSASPNEKILDPELVSTAEYQHNPFFNTVHWQIGGACQAHALAYGTQFFHFHIHFH